MRKNPGRTHRRQQRRMNRKPGQPHFPTYADILMQTWAEQRRPKTPVFTLVGRNPRREWRPALSL